MFSKRQRACVECDAIDKWTEQAVWSSRQWDGSRWGDWKELTEKPERKGELFISRTADPDLGLTYLLYQKVVLDDSFS